MYNKNISPVGWYVASYLIRFIELNNQDNDNLEKRFLSWENTIIIKANDINEAYNKVVEIAKLDTKPYKGGSEGIPVQWIFEGVTELLPIYEEIEDGSEIMWAEHKPKKLKNLRKLVRNKEEFST
jgi:hypothetical protein